MSPRPKEFDREEVLDKAMEVFWRQGFEATSVQDLVDHMGINRGSLYDTFGDKRALFLASVDRYMSVTMAEFLAILERPGRATDGIRALFRLVVESCSSEEGCKGCLLTNSAVELSPHCEETASRVAANIAHVESAFHKTLVRAWSEGDLGNDQNPRAIARFLTSSLHGLKVMGKTSPGQAVLEDIARVTLSVLD